MSSAGKGVLRQGWALYRLALQKHTIATQVISTGVLWGAGDVLSQTVEGQKKNDWTRTAYSACFAGIFVGPLGHYWYLGLDNYARLYTVPGSRKYLAFKILADCILFSPIEIAGFFSFMEAAYGKGIKGVPDKLQSDLWPTLAAQLTYWPMYQWLNFSMVPVRFQLLSVNIAGIFDSAFVCWANSQEGWANNVVARIFSRDVLSSSQEHGECSRAANPGGNAEIATVDKPEPAPNAAARGTDTSTIKQSS